ncbi:MAG: hypothetical protein QF793_02580 [Candidatus Peribacteraceae bacterium]|jgi:uncharacterized integral membrane protein|nr:hypothetical protein [Candidatus Peribacteraceae bacterium]|tara:strand:- start:42 stop:1724 length:1683 start_codon:yes stop_codon:yes gene_type:complete
MLTSARAWALVIIGSAAITAIPFLFYINITGSPLPNVLIQLQSDSLYYLVQVRELIDGHTSLGNPYLLEHANDVFPGMITPIWITAFPALLGFSINTTFAINALLYSLLTGVLLYIFCNKVRKNSRWIHVLIAIAGVALLHNLLIRPVMQIVLPCYLLIAITLFDVLRKPHDSKHYVALGMLCTLAFYMYLYLWMSTFVAVGLYVLWRIVCKDWIAVRYSILMGIAVGLFCLPQILSIISVFNDPNAALISARTGLIETHRIHPLTIMNLKYVIVLCAGLAFVHMRRALRSEELLLLLLGLGLIIAAMSNVVTGTEIDFRTHFWRLSLPLGIIAIAVLLQSVKGRVVRTERVVVLGILCLLIATAINRTVIRANSFAYIRNAKRVIKQQVQYGDYHRVLSVLSNEDDTEYVVMSDSGLAQYIPLYTQHYVLSSAKAALHSAAPQELLERMLINNVDHIDAAYVEEKANAVYGYGPGHQASYARVYGKQVSDTDFIPKEFTKDALALHTDISNNYQSYINKYNVDFIVGDTESPQQLRIPKGAGILFGDERFTIYDLRAMQ